MQLHLALRELVLRHGLETLTSAEDFRAALEDLLGGDESVSAGVINLLVDAVRFQAVVTVMNLVGQGAHPDHAVGAAGQRLAQTRGGADPRAAAWACALLGYAAGYVDEATVRRRGATEPASPRAPDTVAPVPPPPPPLPPRPRPEPPAPTGSLGRRTKWGVTVALLVAVAVAGALAGFITWGDPRDQGSGSTGSADLATVAAATVDDMYSGLASEMSAGAEKCEPEEPPPGIVDQVECVLPSARLTLRTYESLADLETAQRSVLDTRSGTKRHQDDDETYYSFDPDESRNFVASKAEIYWDRPSALQSAHYVVTGGGGFDRLAAAVRVTGPTVTEPTEPQDPRLVRFYTSFGIGDCSRTFTYAVGELEESICTLRGNQVYLAKFESRSRLIVYRAEARRHEARDGVFTGSDVFCHSFDADPVCGSDARESVLGRIHGYVDGDGTSDESGVLYLDRTVCLCYLEVWGFEGDGQGDPDALERVLFR